MKNRIFEVTGILSQNSCILFDIDGLWQRFDCDAKAQEYGFQVIHVSDEMALRFNHEKVQMGGSDEKVLLILDNPAMYVPVDIARLYVVVALSLSTIFPMLSAEALRELPGIDYDWLSASVEHLPFGSFDKAQTLDWCREGMYRAENCRAYSSKLLTTAQQYSQSASGHKDWDIVAKCYAKAAMMQHSGVVLPEWEEKRRSIEEAFVAWIDKKYSIELIMEAYDITVLRTNKLEWKFMNRVLENWENNGCKNVCAVKKDSKKGGSISAEQLEAYERLDELNKQWGSEE